jgi:hypothetical protein
VKRSLAPSLSKRFYCVCDDISATRKFVIYPGNDKFPLSNGFELMGLLAFLQLL